jgi:hypothetical protein
MMRLIRPICGCKKTARVNQTPRIAGGIEQNSLLGVMWPVLHESHRWPLLATAYSNFVGYGLVKHISTYGMPLSIYSRRKGIDSDLTTPK